MKFYVLCILAAMLIMSGVQGNIKDKQECKGALSKYVKKEKFNLLINKYL